MTIQPVLSDHDNSVKKGAGVFRLNEEKTEAVQQKKTGPNISAKKARGI